MKPIKTIPFLAILFLTFEITYLDFDSLSSSSNLRPYLMLGAGIAIFIYWIIIRSKSKEA